MIGIPDEEGAFPATPAWSNCSSTALHHIDKRGQPGNIHYEEYW